jgi:hypothetical protein
LEKVDGIKVGGKVKKSGRVFRNYRNQHLFVRPFLELEVAILPPPSPEEALMGVL